jgi:outer membrane protein assembly factor BamB
MIMRLLIAGAIAVTALAIAAGRLPNMPPPPGMLAENIHGMRPSYAPARLAEVPNEKAITRRVWMPGLDDGYNPQGLAVADGAVLVSAYRSDAADVRRGPCRVFRVAPDSGRATGQLDVPPPCGHAGGLADVGDGTLYVADTHALFATLLRQAFSGRALPFRGIALGAGLVGALAVSMPDAIWLGTYREDGEGRLFRFAAADLARLESGATLNASDASAQLAIPSYAQGAAIDRDGRLWVARSGGRWGELDRLDLKTGKVERRYAVPPGIEGIAFDHDGLLWAVSEAGARHVYDNFFSRLLMPFFPLIFAIDVTRLE